VKPLRIVPYFHDVAGLGHPRRNLVFRLFLGRPELFGEGARDWPAERNSRFRRVLELIT
jgi:hypothetical protein